MTRFFLIIFSVILVLTLYKLQSAQPKKTNAAKPASSAPATATTLKTQKDKVSYSIGLDIGKSFKRQSMDIDYDVLLKGIKDSTSGAKPLLNDSETKEVLMALQQELMSKHQENMRKEGEKNLKEGNDFLEKNKKKAGIVTLPSGLQYQVLKTGTGPKPKATDTVIAHYRGTLINGTEFDSSYKRGTPANFPVSGVIPGWTEALQLMNVGSKWKLFLPPNLGYGEQGAGSDIGPNAVLIFDVELIGIK